jgi:diguanylate cyclase (GGDEF)-like protein
MKSAVDRAGAFRILVIDDNASIHEDFRRILTANDSPAKELATAEALLFGTPSAVAEQEPDYELAFASQGQEGAERVQSAMQAARPFALAFVDMRMPPGWDGIETIERLWAIDPELQVVICSAHSDYQWKDLSRRLGRTDKLLVLKKPFEPIEVLQCASALSRKWINERALRSHVQGLEDVVSARTEKLEAANRQLRHLATHDAPTGLPNRVLLDDRLTQAVAHAQRDAQSFAVMVLDLDRFKQINDSLGHRAGDVVLKEVARRLLATVRDIDTIARIGGDEFVVVASAPATREDVSALARRLNDALRVPLAISGVDIHVTSSIGIALYPGDGANPDVLLARADAAMYCAKQRGRNNVQWFASGMDNATEERLRLESDLHEALHAGQLELFYQPKAETASGEVHSAEALIRWRHPRRGLIAPTEFIPLAEANGLIHEIGSWVLKEACRQCVEWQREGLAGLRVAVNVAATQFRRGDLLEVVRRTLEETGLAPRYLEIELTESTVMTDPEESAATLEQLSRMGVLVSVDDFGTGYSSISYLRRFPIDKLKIDRAFIQDLVTRADDASIVQAIISLAHSLRLKVVAEGVETTQQLDYLRSIGCDQYQGFHFSPPVPAREFRQLLRTWQRTEQPFDRTYSKLARLKA